MATAKFERLVATYRRDHTDPVNHVLHVFVGWPLVAASILLLPFRPWWSLGLFLAGYALMFLGHFAFERNIPTILKHPSTPFVMAWSVIRSLFGGLARLGVPRPDGQPRRGASSPLLARVPSDRSRDREQTITNTP